MPVSRNICTYYQLVLEKPAYGAKNQLNIQLKVITPPPQLITMNANRGQPLKSKSRPKSPRKVWLVLQGKQARKRSLNTVTAQKIADFIRSVKARKDCTRVLLARNMTARVLRTRGFTPADLHSLGLPIKTIKDLGFTGFEFTSTGYASEQERPLKGGYTRTQLEQHFLQDQLYTQSGTLRVTNFQRKIMKKPFNKLTREEVNELRTYVQKVMQKRASSDEIDISGSVFRRLGYPANMVLKRTENLPMVLTAGYTVGELTQAGVIKDPGKELGPNSLNPNKPPNLKDVFSKFDKYRWQDFFRLTFYKSERPNLKKLGIPLGKILSETKNLTYSYLKKFGYTTPDFLKAGVSAELLLNFFKTHPANNATDFFPIKEFKNAGVPMVDLFKAASDHRFGSADPIVPVAELIRGGYSVEQVKPYFSKAVLLQAGLSPRDIASAKPANMKALGLRVSDLGIRRFTVEEILKAGFTESDFHTLSPHQFGSTVAFARMLREKRGLSAIDLLQTYQNSPIPQFSEQQLLRAGFSKKEIEEAKEKLRTKK